VLPLFLELGSILFSLPWRFLPARKQWQPLMNSFAGLAETVKVAFEEVSSCRLSFAEGEATEE
jgi:hypothetical protein